MCLHEIVDVCQALYWCLKIQHKQDRQLPTCIGSLTQVKKSLFLPILISSLSKAQLSPIHPPSTITPACHLPSTPTHTFLATEDNGRSRG